MSSWASYSLGYSKGFCSISRTFTLLRAALGLFVVEETRDNGVF
jgi:hypothetical protein